MRYYKFPKWLKRFYPDAIWDFSFSKNAEKTIYLTFDDGPNPETTPWLLSQLEKYKATATFFCVGQNVLEHSNLYQQILEANHQVGNHTNQHLNGWFTSTKKYLGDIQKAEKLIDSKLFRAPYGKIKPSQYKALQEHGFKTVFWSHITYDFDNTLCSTKRINNTLAKSKNGSIVVFHDSTKAFPQLKKELPTLLQKWHSQGYNFKTINSSEIQI